MHLPSVSPSMNPSDRSYSKCRRIYVIRELYTDMCHELKITCRILLFEYSCSIRIEVCLVLSDVQSSLH